MAFGTLFLLVIAHPDDESMFFLPTLYNIIYGRDSYTQDAPIDYHILCFSNGNYDGLGVERARELEHAAMVVSPMIKVTVLDDPQLQDGPDESWSEAAIENAMVDFFEQRINNDVCSSRSTSICNTSGGTMRNIILFTFDEGGVSGHVNHIDTNNGLKQFYYKFHDMKQASGHGNRIDLLSQTMNLQLLTLRTIYNPMKKYFPIFEVLSMLWRFICSSRSYAEKRGHQKHIFDDQNAPILFHMFRPKMVWNAMSAHYTQFVWYRRLFVIFSIYSYTNILNHVTFDKKDYERKKEN